MIEKSLLDPEFFQFLDKQIKEFNIRKKYEELLLAQSNQIE